MEITSRISSQTGFSPQELQSDAHSMSYPLIFQFSFTVRVEDSNPAGPCLAERALKLAIGPADPQTFAVK